MNVVLEHGARRATAASMASTVRPSRVSLSTTAFRCGPGKRLRTSQCCVCTRYKSPLAMVAPRDGVPLRRCFSVSINCLDEPRRPITLSEETKAPRERVEEENRSPVTPPSSLPSQTHRRRWQVSKRMARMMDTLLARAFVWGQNINVYTGTDYSGIEFLRKEIDIQEQKVRDTHREIDAARSKHHEVHAKQAASQKEIVSLLERKSSWSPEDLERYMSLVRSEHTDEQAVQGAKDGLNETERDLENARAELERLERKQYHEEQIWSDTIRRNSTWVTFGLMGVNIVLLLAQILIFEPYRRRKIVKEVNQALDEKAVIGSASPVEKQIDMVVEPRGVPLEAVASVPEQPLDVFVPDSQDPSKAALPVGDEMSPEEVTHASRSAPSASSQLEKQNTWSDRWEHYKDSLQDLFSERIIEVKKVDITNKALQGAATGVATMGLLFVLWRPK